jgi:hypothetical protein
MSTKPYCALSAVLFALVAVGHAVRAARALPLVIGSLDVPVAASWLVALVGTLLAIWGLRLALRP